MTKYVAIEFFRERFWQLEVGRQTKVGKTNSSRFDRGPLWCRIAALV